MADAEGRANRRLRVAFVAQRYGADIGGGAEDHCRQVATRMARHWDVTVLTTTAGDYLTWSSRYPAGESLDGGVRVLRFPIRSPRNVPAFDGLSPRVLDDRHSDEDELRWLVLQGPDCPGLLDYLASDGGRYDIVVFFTYLYATTAFGLPLVADRAWLVPTAHDEKPIYLRYFDGLFSLPRQVLFNTEAERRFCCRRFSRPADWGHVVGCGVARTPPAPEEAVRRKFDLPAKYLLYLGRIDPAKGVAEMLDFYHQAAGRTSDLPPLLLAGHQTMDIPRGRNVRSLGFVSGGEKARLLAAAELLVMPSFFESLSLVLLEAWSEGTAALVNGRCEVLRDQVVRAGGGLYYDTAEEFAEGLGWLLARPELRRRMGRSGRAFTAAHYDWTRIEEAYLRIADFTGPRR